MMADTAELISAASLTRASPLNVRTVRPAELTVSTFRLRWDILNLPGLVMIMLVRIKTDRQHIEKEIPIMMNIQGQRDQLWSRTFSGCLKYRRESDILHGRLGFCVR